MGSKRMVAFASGKCTEEHCLSVEYRQGHGISPVGYTAPLAVAVHQLPKRKSTLARRHETSYQVIKVMIPPLST